MEIRRLEADAPALAEVDRLLEARHGRGLGSFGWASGRAVVLGGFVEDRLVAFGIFRDYRDPQLHVGSEVNLDAIGDILAMEEVALYRVALLHAEEDEVGQRGASEQILRAFEDELAERSERYCLLITLLRRGNAPALGLFTGLGFKKAGRPSSLMRFDLARLGRLLDRIPPLPDELIPRFFDEAEEGDLEGFARCYQEVFLRGRALSEEEMSQAVASVLGAPDFSRHLSLLLLTREGLEVVGFMLARHVDQGDMQIDVAGLLPEVRGQRLPYRCLPPIARRALASGITGATFVTVQSRVVRLTLRAFGAREVDQLQTYIRVG